MSALNCRPGDLAVIVRSQAGNEGRIVRCIRLLNDSEADAIGYWSGAVWLIDQPIQSKWGSRTRFVPNCPDKQMRPIRDPGEDARDETLSWKRVPSSSTTKDAEVSNG